MMELSSDLKCPSCQQPVKFAHHGINIKQCPCGTVVYRHNNKLDPKPYFILLDTSDQLAPGTTGKWQERSFTITGRIRCWFEESVYNYWTIIFDNGDIAWLGEGYGLYSIMLPTEPTEPITASDVQRLKIGESYDWVLNTLYPVQSIETCYRWELQGEVWLPAQNETFRLIESATSEGVHLAAFGFGKNNISHFHLYYCGPADLHFTALLQQERKVHRFNCGNCSKEIQVKTFPYAQSCVCPACNARHVLDNGRFRSTGKFNETTIAPAIKLGSKGSLENINYEVIGYTLKEENNRYASQWREYVLHNDLEGYAFLSEYDGHWMYVREMGDTPVLPSEASSSFDYGHEPFTLFNRYHYSVINAHGEFPYNIFNVKRGDVKEFISPPEMWIRERTPERSIVWFLGKHIKGADIEKAFEMPAGLPYKRGVGAIEPRNYINPSKLGVMAGVGALLLILLHLLAGAFKQNRIILDEAYAFKDSAQIMSAISPRFTLPKASSNLELKIGSPVDNSWFALEANLVNTKTGAEYALEKGVEYYHGYTDGESWTEGSRTGTAYFTQIPAGTYLLQFKGMREDDPYGLRAVKEFHLRVTYDVQNHRNLLFCLLFLMLWPIGKYIHVNHIEKSRWYNSPFSPYTYED